MKDLYLKFEHQEQAEHTFIQAGFLRDESGGLYHPDICMDVIGCLYTTDNPDADEPEYTALPGWHINLRIVGDITTDALTPYTVTPDTPVRVWA